MQEKGEACTIQKMLLIMHIRWQGQIPPPDLLLLKVRDSKTTAHWVLPEALPLGINYPNARSFHSSGKKI